MSFMRLVETKYSTDFTCPHCQCNISVESWDTEYGDPLPGETYVNCPKCEKQFKVEVDVTTTYRVISK